LKVIELEKMKVINVDLGERSYPIYIDFDLLANSEIICQHIKSKQVLVLTNETIAPLYLERLLVSLSAYQVQTLVLPDGEQYKTIDTVTTIFDSFLENQYGRNATLIALGGGVVGDMGGFAAACFQRGVPFIQVPTTLLAQVDSSVGGKTGVNHPLGKNMIGAFYQPECVVVDTQVLKTLDDRQLSAGLAEVIKYGLIRDPDFFSWLEQNMPALRARDYAALSYAIERCCLAKAQIVAEDEKEAGVRAILNLGHTFGHAIESGSGYGVYLHGEAVAIGCCQAADLSRRLGYLSASDVERIIAIFQRAGLPTKPPKNLSTDDYLAFMGRDKKNIDGHIHLILLAKIGWAELPVTVDIDTLVATLENYGAV
jgi:3-dehydroquinate synthase